MRTIISFMALILLAAQSCLADPATEVPYYRQYDNADEGGSACNITSVAMMLDYFDIAVPSEVRSRTPDKLYDRFGVKYNPEELQAVFNIIARESGAAVRDVFYERGTFKQLQAELAAGNPVIVHGWFTTSGHIMVVTDYDGEHYTVHDPAGRWNLKKWGENAYDTAVSGKGIQYPAAAFEHAINDNGTGDDLWLHTFKALDQTP